MLVVVHVRAAGADRGDLDEHFAGPGLGHRSFLHRDLADSFQYGSTHGRLRHDGILLPGYGVGRYLTEPRDRPWTSLSWAAKPATSKGSETMKEAAQSGARNRPWLVTKLVRKTGAVSATVAVRTRANSSSFQAKMKQIRAVAAMPGMTTGAITERRVLVRFAPSTWAASSISTGTSDRNERIIHTAMGRFIEV